MSIAFDPWRHVDTDDDLVADLLAGSLGIVVESGGWIHPRARLVVRKGQGSVECDARDGEPLLRVPREALLRIGRVDWADDDEELAFDGVPDEFGEAETELLLLQVALHNACGKIPWLVRTHPAMAPDMDEELVSAVRALRPSFRRRRPSPASLLWSTRVFRLPIGDDGRSEPVAVPLIDLLNHDRSGATGSWTGDALEVGVAHLGSTSQGVLNYGHQRDAIGMAVVHGFVDVSADLAHSAPVLVDVDGPIRVEGRGRDATGALLAPVARREGSGWLISHLVFDARNPQRAESDIAAALDVEAGMARKIVAAVAQENERLLAPIMSAEASGEAAATLTRAAQHQASVIAEVTRRPARPR